MAKRHSTAKYLNLQKLFRLYILMFSAHLNKRKKAWDSTRSQRHMLNEYLITHRHPHLQSLPLNPTGTPRAAWTVTTVLVGKCWTDTPSVGTQTWNPVRPVSTFSLFSEFPACPNPPW